MNNNMSAHLDSKFQNATPPSLLFLLKIKVYNTSYCDNIIGAKHNQDIFPKFIIYNVHLMRHRY